jgi:hypothetical protein
VNSLIFAGLQGGPRLGDAEAGAAAALAGPQFAAWSGGVLSVVTAVVTCWAIPQFWRYRSDGGAVPARPAGDPSAGQAAALEPAVAQTEAGDSAVGQMEAEEPAAGQRLAGERD